MSRSKAIPIAALAVIAVVLVAAWAFRGPSDPVKLLSSDSPGMQEKGMSSLSAERDTPEGMRRLGQALSHKDPAVACRALRAIAGGHGPTKPLAPRDLEVVKKAAADPRPEVKSMSIRILEATTPPAPEDTAVPELILRMFRTETSPETRAAAADALGKLQYWPAMEPLLDALEDDSALIRGAAGVAVRTILGLNYGFRAEDPPAKRAAVVERIREQWKLQYPFHLDYIRRLRERRKAEP